MKEGDAESALQIALHVPMMARANLPQAFSVGADLSTEEVRASDAGESGRGK